MTSMTRADQVGLSSVVSPSKTGTFLRISWERFPEPNRTWYIPGSRGRPRPGEAARTSRPSRKTWNLGSLPMGRVMVGMKSIPLPLGSRVGSRASWAWGEAADQVLSSAAAAAETARSKAAARGAPITGPPRGASFPGVTM